MSASVPRRRDVNVEVGVFEGLGGLGRDAPWLGAGEATSPGSRRKLAKPMTPNLDSGGAALRSTRPSCSSCGDGLKSTTFSNPIISGGCFGRSTGICYRGLLEKMAEPPEVSGFFGMVMLVPGWSRWSQFKERVVERAVLR